MTMINILTRAAHVKHMPIKCNNSLNCPVMHANLAKNYTLEKQVFNIFLILHINCRLKL